MLKNFVVAAVAMLTATVSFSQSYNTPESVEYDAVNNRYLISNKGAGEILARSASGTLSVFTSLPSSPHGLHIEGSTLYVCDGARVKGYDLTSAAEVMNINLGATFLNGITADGSGNLYVTDFTAKKIYRVNIASQGFNVFVTSLVKSPNGILYDAAGSRLIFVSWGSNAPINEVLLSDSTVNQLTSTTLSNCDGITRDCAGNYYVTAWGTQALHRFTSTFTGSPVTVATGLSSPADICYNAAGDTIAIPNSGNNTVVFYYVNCTGVSIDDNVSIKTGEMYPIPAAGVLYVKISDVSPQEKVRCGFYDSAGSLVAEYNEFFDSSESGFNIDHFKAGIYFIRLTYSGKTVTRKFVKQ